MLATSVADREIFGMRELGEDRKGFFDHFKLNNFIKGVSVLTLVPSAWFIKDDEV